MASHSEDSLLEDPSVALKEILSTQYNNCGGSLVPMLAGLSLSPPNEPVLYVPSSKGKLLLILLTTQDGIGLQQNRLSLP